MVQTVERTNVVTLAPLSRIRANPWNPRTTEDQEGFEELVQSVRRDGILQPPVVRERDGYYELAFGHRRFTAALVIQKEDPDRDTLPVIIKEIFDEEMAVWGIEENEKRKDITPIEVARAVDRYIKTFEKTQAQAGKRLGLNQSSIANMIRVLRLPKSILATVDEGEISFSGAKVLTCLLSEGCNHEDLMLQTIKSAGRYTEGREGPLTVKIITRCLCDVATEEYGHKTFMFSLNTGRWNGPTFDVEAFKKKHQSRIHTLPGGENVTCAMKEWKTLDGVARNEAKKKEAGKKQTSMAKLMAKAESAAEILSSGDPIEIQESYGYAKDPETGEYGYLSEETPFTEKELVPDPNRPIPVAGSDAGEVPAVDTHAHTMIEGVGVARASAETLEAALGTRNKVLGEIDWSLHESYVDMDKHGLAIVKDPEECTKRCTWGMCWKKVQGQDDKTYLKRICTNMKCNDAKVRMHREEVLVRGQEGIEAEDQRIDDVIAHVITKASFAVGKAVSRMLLDTLIAAGAWGRGASWVTPGNWLQEYFKIPGKKGSEAVQKALQERLDSLFVRDLRVLILHMALARLRGSTRPLEWTPELDGYLEAIKNTGTK